MNDYTGDGYDRMGCSVRIDVKPRGIAVSMYRPDELGGRPFESYIARSKFGAAIILLEWLSGRAPSKRTLATLEGDSSHEDLIHLVELYLDERRNIVASFLDSIEGQVPAAEKEGSVVRVARQSVA